MQRNVTFIGEIGINHQGDIEKALAIAKGFVGIVDVIKIQVQTPSIMPAKLYNAPHPDPENAFAETYGKHKEFLELSIDDINKLCVFVRSKDMKFAASVFDLPALYKIADVPIEWIKIPSCRANDWPLIDEALRQHQVVHASIGMTTEKERNALMHRTNNIIPYDCTANYSDQGPVYVTGLPGFSCHSISIAFAMAAIMAGSNLIEFHITLDRKWKGTDQKISLLPSEYKRLRKWWDDNAEAFGRIERRRPMMVAENEQAARSKLWR